MHNFGRGMWRRVGDYDKFNSYKNAQIQHYSAFIEYQKQGQRQEAVKKYRNQVLNSVKYIHTTGTGVNKSFFDKVNTIKPVITEPYITEEPTEFTHNIVLVEMDIHEDKHIAY
jgi:hypothetical protein